MSEFIPSIENRIQEFLAQPDYRPLKQHELARALKIKSSKSRLALRRALRQLEKNGQVVCLRKNRWALPESGKFIRGDIRVTVHRFAFVTPEDPSMDDIFVPEKNLGTALDGDRVLLNVHTLKSKRRGKHFEGDEDRKRTEGRVVRVIERRRTSLVGLLCRTAYYWYVIPDSPRILQTVRVRDFAVPDKPTEHHKVRVELDDWQDEHKPLSGIVNEDLGAADAPGVDIISILRDHQLDSEFPEDCLSEAHEYSPAPPADALTNRKDLREIIVFTIDPEDAKDFDDAVSIQRSANGNLILSVHIADVSYYIHPGSTVDREARQRGNSVYLVDRVIPMLPPYLTTEVCSLQAGVDRLTHSVEMEFDKEGNLIHALTYPSIIRSSARLTYDQVQVFFDNEEGTSIPDDVMESLRMMRPLARVLRKKRIAEGSIDLTMPEVRCILNEKGVPIEIRKRTSFEAYQFIEEFMLAANCVVARKIASAEVPAIYRIHPPPDDEQWEKMQMALWALNIGVKITSRDDLNRAVQKAAEQPISYTAHLAILRNLKRAHYSSSLSEHFGLAFPCYTHFTSPIRRYPDLVVHRILKAIEQKERPPLSNNDAARIAEHCSWTERNADDAEEESITIKRIEFYANCLRNRDTGPYKATIVNLTPKGLIVELTETLQRGMVTYASIQDDHYVLARDRSCARGRRRRKEFPLGQQLDVYLARVDETRRLVDFTLAIETPSKSTKKKHGKKHKKRNYKRRNG